MIPWAEVREHTAANLTLLCDNHHRQKTGRLLSPDQVIAANAAPHNVGHGVSAPFGLNLAGNECTVLIGNNRFMSSRKGATGIISVDNIDLLWLQIEEGKLLLNANIFDAFNNLALSVVQNELVYTTKTWDIEFVGNRLTLRERAKHILLEIEFRVPSVIALTRGSLLCNGAELLVGSHGITCGERIISGCIASNCDLGLVVGRHERRLGAAMGWPDVPRLSPPSRLENRQAGRRAINSVRHIIREMGPVVSTVRGFEDFGLPIESAE